MTDDSSPCLRVSVVNSICSTNCCAGSKTGERRFVPSAQASDSAGADVPGPPEFLQGGEWSRIGGRYH